MKHVLWVVLTVAWVAGVGCATISEESETIRGTVAYRQKIAMPADALVVVQLVDLTASETEPVVIATTTIKDPGQVPVYYELKYRPSEAPAGRRLAVQARIDSGGKPWMVTGTVNHTMHFGRIARADVMLRPAPAASGL